MKYSWSHFFIAVTSLMLLASTASAQLTDAQWRADLDTLAETLLDRHPDFYTKHSVEEFKNAFDALDSQIQTLDSHQIVMELCRLVALGGDSHTSIGFGVAAKSMHKLPIRCIVLSDGVFISAANKANEQLIGAQILRFGDTDADEAYEKIGVLFGYENHWKLINAGSSYITLLPALAAVGIAEDYRPDSFTLTIRDEAGVRDIELDCTVPAAKQPWVSFVEHLPGEVPLAYRKSRGYYQSEFISEHNAMYIAYNKCTESEDFPISLFTTFIMEKSEELNAQRIIIDLRSNDGGDETVIWPFIDALKESKRFTNKGDIIVLTSRWTYSSAMSNAHQFRDRVGAVLIGEPTGGKPNHFGQLDSFVLPNSMLKVYYSTKYFKKVPGDPDAVHPDILIEVGSEDFFAGIDRVLDKAFSYEPE